MFCGSRLDELAAWRSELLVDKDANQLELAFRVMSRAWQEGARKCSVLRAVLIRQCCRREEVSPKASTTACSASRINNAVKVASRLPRSLEETNSLWVRSASPSPGRLYSVENANVARLCKEFMCFTRSKTNLLGLF
jgi:hypothetical protein